MRNRNQVVFPINLEISIPKDDFVFKVAEICEKLDYTEVFETYIRTWRKVNPITLFEILVFGYMNRKFSSREIEMACKTDIRFMWLLSGEPAPSDSTLTRFTRGHLGEAIEGLFYQFVEKLYEMGEVKFKNLFVDGTKIEAYANKYTFVWKKAVEKNQEKLNKKIAIVLPLIAERYGFKEFITIEDGYEALVKQAEWNNMIFAVGKGKHKTQLQRDIELLESFMCKRNEYYCHLGKFGNRNSFSKTDVDATFMHMKDDYMRNGQLKPGYNIQIGVESEYVVGVGAFSNRSDVNTLIPFLNRIKSNTNRIFEQIIADAGYESSENYLYLEENGQKCFIKPTNYEISKKRTYKTNPYAVENMAYNEKKDEYTCPDGRKLKFRRESTKTTENGYTVSTKYYSNDKCGRCPHRDKCHHSKNGYRTVKVNQVLNEYRHKVLEALTSEEGTLLRMNRSIQVEGVFGVLKEDYGFRRFLTRGKKNVETQFFLLAFAFNIEKLCNRIKKGRFGLDLFQLNVS
jgi:transposase